MASGVRMPTFARKYTTTGSSKSSPVPSAQNATMLK